MQLFPARSAAGFDGLLHVGRLTTALPALAPRVAQPDRTVDATTKDAAAKEAAAADAAVEESGTAAQSAQGRLKKPGTNIGDLLRPRLDAPAEGGTRPVEDVPQVEPEGGDVELRKQ